MQAQQKLFIIAWSAVVVVFIGLMAMFYASLIPHFQEIGDWAVWVVRLLMVCVSAFAVAFTAIKIKTMWNESRFVQRGEVVTYIGPNKPYVVSADHEAAKIPRMLPAPPDEKLEATDETIVELWQDGQMTLEAIASQLNISYYRVQRVTSEAKKRGLARK